MATEIFSEIKKQVAQLSAEEMRSLASFLNEEAEKKKVSSEANGEKQAGKTIDKYRGQQIIDWLKSHDVEYGGKYVALYGDEIELVAEGKTYKEANERAKEKGIKTHLWFTCPRLMKCFFEGGKKCLTN